LVALKPAGTALELRTVSPRWPGRFRPAPFSAGRRSRRRDSARWPRVDPPFRVPAGGRANSASDVHQLLRAEFTDRGHWETERDCLPARAIQTQRVNGADCPAVARAG